MAGVKVAELPRNPSGRMYPTYSASSPPLVAIQPRAGAIGQPAHHHAAEAHGDEAQHVGERRHRAAVAELGGDLLQRDHWQVDRAAAQHDAQHRDDGEAPGVGAVDAVAITND